MKEHLLVSNYLVRRGVMKKLQMYMKLAQTVAENGTCPRAKVGAVLVNDDRVIGLGFNGAARKLPHCNEVGCKIIVVDGVEHCIRSCHGEENVIVNAAAGGARTKNGIIFCTHSPCYRCARLIINAGIIDVYYLNFYGDLEALDILRVGGVRVEQFKM